jgi:hypothetical protein
VKKRRRHTRERKLVFPWERTAPAFAWVSRRRAGALALVSLLVFGAWSVLSVDDRRRRTSATRAAIRSVMVATEAFRADHGRCPTGIDELARPAEVAGVTGRYLAEVRVDGWGNPLTFSCPGGKHPTSADVVSQGAPDGLLFPAEPID